MSLPAAQEVLTLQRQLAIRPVLALADGAAELARAVEETPLGRTVKTR